MTYIMCSVSIIILCTLDYICIVTFTFIIYFTLDYIDITTVSVTILQVCAGTVPNLLITGFHLRGGHHTLPHHLLHFAFHLH